MAARNPVVMCGGLPILFSDMLWDIEDRLGVEGRDAYLMGFRGEEVDCRPLTVEEHRKVCRTSELPQWVCDNLAEHRDAFAK